MKGIFGNIHRFVFIFLIAFLFLGNANAQDGKALFQQKCATCHAVDKDLTGPALKGVQERVKDHALLIRWIQNNQKVLAEGDKYFTDLYAKWNKTPMNVFSDMSTEQVEAILTYVKDWKPTVKVVSPDDQKDAGTPYLLVILFVVLVIVALALWAVLSTMKRAATEKEGIANKKNTPFYRKKVNITLMVLFAVGLFTVWLVNTMMGAGRNREYQPVQPIYFSHKVHAGVNQVNCLYCHTSAQQSKISGIPSVNVCMNCHAAINEYTGDPIHNAEGEQVDGTAEIKKLYAYAGWDPVKKSYALEPTPIAWTRIHNLPDHVLFNHDQHVVNAKVQCQTCHGEVQAMDEVKQVAELSMGWCVNCHRNTKVAFTENAFYSTFEKFHNDLKSGKIDSVTAAMIGANECQRCHY